jgi:hypothetical protein
MAPDLVRAVVVKMFDDEQVNGERTAHLFLVTISAASFLPIFK